MDIDYGCGDLMGRGSENATPGAATPPSADPPRSLEQAKASCAPPAQADALDLQLRLHEILQRISGADPQQITPEARLIEDIGIDSLGFYEILIEADECLGIKIREEDLLTFRTVGDIQNHLRSLEPTDGEAH